jgi:hypothetical protein
VPPEALAAPLAADIVAREQLAEDGAIREAANAVALIGDLRHLEPSGPCSLVVIAHVDPGTWGEGRPCVRIWRRPPSAHATIVLTFAAAA